VSELRIGDLVTVHAGEAEQGGRVTARHGDKVEVELYDRPGLRFWFPSADVRTGTARPRPMMMAARWGKETRVEVRAVCRHLNLADVCRDCAKG
jgi:hypothetical protein